MHNWGHVDERHRINVGLTRPQRNRIMTADARMSRTATDAALHHLSTWAQKARLTFEIHRNPDGALSQTHAGPR
eukprot:7433895-Pyramimonas_sp.AAC.1